MSRPTAHNVVATFGTPEQARDALEALSRAGFDADKVSLVGHDAEEVASDPDTRLRDLDATGEVGKKAAASGALGSVLGGLAGAAAFAIPGVGPVVGTGILGALLAGGIAGGTLGGMVGGIASMELSESWELTFSEALRDGKALVAAHTDTDEEAQEAEKALQNEDPEKIEHLDADGNSLSDS
jgi:hypothetical protein